MRRWSGRTARERGVVDPGIFSMKGKPYHNKTPRSRPDDCTQVTVYEKPPRELMTHRGEIGLIPSGSITHRHILCPMPRCKREATTIRLPDSVASGGIRCPYRFHRLHHWEATVKQRQWRRLMSVAVVQACFWVLLPWDLESRPCARSTTSTKCIRHPAHGEYRRPYEWRYGFGDDSP